ncbi:hypothetical protein WJX82_011628 [Trebouxia sp. C0006]
MVKQRTSAQVLAETLQRSLTEPCLARQSPHAQATCSGLSRRVRPASQPRHTAKHSLIRRSRQYPQLSTSALSADAEVTLTSLQAELETAVSAEDYQRAATLRDEVTKLQQDCTAAVTEANRRFYAAFEHCNLQAMKEIWGNGDQVQCLHPAANCIEGREDVLESWRLVLRGDFQIRLENVRVHATQTSGYVTCVEVMNAGNATGRTVATNIFEKQNGRWKLVLHQGGPLPTASGI